MAVLRINFWQPYFTSIKKVTFHRATVCLIKVLAWHIMGTKTRYVCGSSLSFFWLFLGIFFHLHLTSLLLLQLLFLSFLLNFCLLVLPNRWLQVTFRHLPFLLLLGGRASWLGHFDSRDAAGGEDAVVSCYAAWDQSANAVGSHGEHAALRLDVWVAWGQGHRWSGGDGGRGWEDGAIAVVHHVALQLLV